VLSKIDERGDIIDAFTRRKLLQQGYQSELRTLFKPVTEEIKKLPVSIIGQFNLTMVCYNNSLALGKSILKDILTYSESHSAKVPEETSRA